MAEQHDDNNKTDDLENLFEQLNIDDQDLYTKKIYQAKAYIKQGKVTDALTLNQEALKIFHNDRLARKIEKMKIFIEQYGDTPDESPSETIVCDGFSIRTELYQRLYPHQIEGVTWLWKLYKMRKGGILGDDMGLGKTIQTVAFLSGMFHARRVSTIVIVIPVSVMVTWEQEFQKWAPDVRVLCYHGNSKRERQYNLQKTKRKGGVLLTSYGMVVTSWESLSADHVWDYLILDEGHKIKNPNKTSKAVHAITATHRLILTGTPIQNNLKELWALFNFVHHGQLLGTLPTFKSHYELPIIKSREKDATLSERTHGQNLSHNLRQIISPYFLQRTKEEVVQGEEEDTHTEELAKMPSFTRKNDFILWIPITDIQQEIYEQFLTSEQVKNLLMTKKSPLVQLTVLKKICDHPRLLTTKACIELGLEENMSVYDEAAIQECAANRLDHITDETLIGETGKLKVLVRLLDNLKEEGHRSLIFSESRKMLNIIQRILSHRGHKTLRLDGTIVKLTERNKIVEKFQKKTSVSTLLLTTQVGGVGLTLTGANRVIIYDPSWNPAVDAQAVDRAFRIGQDKDVIIYRLITCGTVEEKIYRRQIFKDSIKRQTTTNDSNPYRYFTKGELRDLFILDDPHSSTTQMQLEELHGSNRTFDAELDHHVAFLHALGIFGISEHSLMFCNTPEDTAHNDSSETVNTHLYSQTRVEEAQKLIEQESRQPETMDAHNEIYFRHLSGVRKEAAIVKQKPTTPSSKEYNNDISSDENSMEAMHTSTNEPLSATVVEVNRPKHRNSSQSVNSTIMSGLSKNNAIIIENDQQTKQIDISDDYDSSERPAHGKTEANHGSTNRSKLLEPYKQLDRTSKDSVDRTTKRANRKSIMATNKEHNNVDKTAWKAEADQERHEQTRKDRLSGHSSPMGIINNDNTPLKNVSLEDIKEKGRLPKIKPECNDKSVKIDNTSVIFDSDPDDLRTNKQNFLKSTKLSDDEIVIDDSIDNDDESIVHDSLTDTIHVNISDDNRDKKAILVENNREADNSCYKTAKKHATIVINESDEAIRDSSVEDDDYETAFNSLSSIDETGDRRPTVNSTLPESVANRTTLSSSQVGTSTRRFQPSVFSTPTMSTPTNYKVYKKDLIISPDPSQPIVSSKPIQYISKITSPKNQDEEMKNKANSETDGSDSDTVVVKRNRHHALVLESSEDESDNQRSEQVFQAMGHQSYTKGTNRETRTAISQNETRLVNQSPPDSPRRALVSSMNQSTEVNSDTEGSDNDTVVVKRNGHHALVVESSEDESDKERSQRDIQAIGRLTESDTKGMNRDSRPTTPQNATLLVNQSPAKSPKTVLVSSMDQSAEVNNETDGSDSDTVIVKRNRHASVVESSEDESDKERSQRDNQAVRRLTESVTKGTNRDTRPTTSQNEAGLVNQSPAESRKNKLVSSMDQSTDYETESESSHSEYSYEQESD